MTYVLDDTIAAIASPAGRAARGILRLSGPEVQRCLVAVFHAQTFQDLNSITAPSAVAGALAIPTLASPLPCEVFLWPSSRSYTGQVVAEIHTLGSRPLLESVLRSLCASGARLAEPGEFTLRAVLAGRIDLTRAEAVLGVIDATDGDALSVALSQLAGGLSSPLEQLRETLLDLLAELEAGLDFADEDLPTLEHDELSSRLAAAAEIADRLAEQMDFRHQSNDRVGVVLVGWPNAGKSSLFNALAGRGSRDRVGTSRHDPRLPHRRTRRGRLQMPADRHGRHFAGRRRRNNRPPSAPPKTLPWSRHARRRFNSFASTRRERRTPGNARNSIVGTLAERSF